MIQGREFGNVYRLFVGVQCPKDSAGVHVEYLCKFELDQTSIIPCDHQFSVRPNVTTPCDIFESRNSFRNLLGTGGIYLNSRGRSYRVPMGFGGGEVDGGDWRIFLDENWVFVLSPVS